MLMDTNQKGKITEVNILAYVLGLGYSVSVPFGDKDRYDQIWDINGKLLKVQIKTASSVDEQNSAIVFSCRSVSNGKAHSYSKEDIDFFATYWNGKVYLIPIEECSSQKKLRFFSPNSNQVKRINWAKDYEIEEVLKRVEI
jgi:hypothetical protein